MKNIFKSLALMFALLMGGEVVAQTSDIMIQRRCLDQAITTIEDYELMATVGDDETRYAFMALFTDSAVVYNDLLGLSTRDWLKIDEYCKLLTDGLHNRKATVKNIKSEDIIREGDLWLVRMSFDKSISYVNSCGVYFSSEDIFERDYRLTAHMRYNPQNGDCKIFKITGDIDSSKGIPNDYIVFEKNDARDDQLEFRNKKMLFNRYKQAFLDGPITKADFRYKDPDVTANIVFDDQCKKVSMAYKARPMRLRLHYDIGLGSAFSLDAGNPLTTKSSSNSFGLEWGYVFPSKGKLKTGIFLGTGMTNAKIDLEMNSSDYFYETNADVDGDTYTRHYHDLALIQTAKLTEVNVPVYLDFDYHISQWVSLYADLGAKVNLMLSSKTDELEGSAYVDGTYPIYNEMTLDETWGYNGFGPQTYSMADNGNSELDGIAKTSFDALIGAGLRVNIPTTPLSVDLGVSYRKGLTEITTSDRTDLNLYSNVSHPVVFNSISGLNSSEHVRNMTDALASIKRSALKLTIGINYKF